MKNVQYIAFYGTLKQGSANPFDKEISDNLKYIGACKIKGRLYDLGRIPALKLGDNGEVTAELYEITKADVLSILDKYEAIDNINPNHPGYSRVLAKLADPYKQAWVYEYNGSPASNQVIESGTWPTHRDMTVRLAIRTDKPEAELYIFGVGNSIITKDIWQADRRLADELLPHLTTLMSNNDVNLLDVTGIIIYTGTGSFTGLRIGTTVANTIAYAQNIPIIESTDEDWLKTGLQQIKLAKPGNYVVPKYSSEPNITKPKS